MTVASAVAQLRQFPRCRLGSNAVEFCLLLPVFLLLLGGMSGFGLYLGAAHSVAQLAAEGARASLAGLNAAERDGISRDLVRKFIVSYPLLQAENLSVDTVEAGASFSVIVRYDTGSLPIWNLGFNKFVPDPVIERAAVIEFARF